MIHNSYRSHYRRMLPLVTLLPLALAIGQGSGIQQPLAIAIIAGLLLQYPLVLLAMPVLLGFTLPRSRALPEPIGSGSASEH